MSTATNVLQIHREAESSGRHALERIRMALTEALNTVTEQQELYDEMDMARRSRMLCNLPPVLVQAMYKADLSYAAFAAVQLQVAAGIVAPRATP